MVTYRIRKMIAWGMAVTMTAGMTNVLTGCGAEREGQAVETSQVEDTSQGDEDTPAYFFHAGELESPYKWNQRGKPLYCFYIKPFRILTN